MSIQDTQSLKPLERGQGKYSRQLTEEQTIFYYLQDHIATASMVCNAIGIKQKNFTRYKRDLEQAGKLFEVVKEPCKITGCKAWYLSTNPYHNNLNSL